MATAASGSSASSSDGEASGCCARAGCCDGKGGGCIWETTSAHATPWRARLYGLMFEYSGTSGTVAAVVIFTSIVLSVTLVCLGSVAWISATLWVALVMDWIELLFIIIFGAEYLLRSLSVKRWHTYGLSVFGIVMVMFAADQLPAVIQTFVPALLRLLPHELDFREPELAQLGHESLNAQRLFCIAAGVAMLLARHSTPHFWVSQASAHY